MNCFLCDKPITKITGRRITRFYKGERFYEVFCLRCVSEMDARGYTPEGLISFALKRRINDLKEFYILRNEIIQKIRNETE